MAKLTYFVRRFYGLIFINHRKKKADLPLFLGILFLIVLSLQLSLPFNLPLVHDELYHVNDRVVAGELSTINPYSSKYQFLGHPPGYRISLLLWFKLFPGTHISARYFSALMTVGSLIIVFVVLSRFSNRLSSLSVPLFFLVSHAYVKLGNSVTGNMHEFMLLLLCLYFYINRKMTLMALFFLFLVASRESGLSFAIAFFLMELDRKRSIKNVVMSCFKWLGPGLLLFAIFALLNYLDKGHIIGHPYAHGGLAHLPENFGLLTFNDYKFKNFLSIVNNLNFYLSGSEKPYLYIVGLIQLILISFLLFKNYLGRWGTLYQKLQQPEVRELIIFTTSINLAYFIFYSLYGDYVLRDLIPCLILIPLSLYLFIFLVSSRYYGLACIILITLFLINRGYVIARSNYAKSILDLKDQAREMEERFEGLTVCYPWPFRLAHEKVHGLFSVPFKTQFSCKEAHVWPIFKFQSNEMNEFVKSLIDEHDMEFVYSYKEPDWGFSAKLYKSEELVGRE